jgi:Methyltransferase domain
MSELYDRIAPCYIATRREDPRLAALIRDALGPDVRTVINVGAGAGAYEPRDLDVTAVEPTAAMRANRPPGAAPAIDARAEALPFENRAFDASMTVFSDHHWQDRAQGLHELRRVARQRVVVLTYDPEFADAYWLIRDYLPGFGRLPGMAVEEVAAHLGGAEIRRLPVWHDCLDGFLLAYWRRPEAFLDPEVRAAISVFHRLPEDDIQEAVGRLRADLQSGAWAKRNRDILELERLDVGLVLLVAGA